MKQIATYPIFFGIDISNNNESNKTDIKVKDVEIKENFDFYDYNLEATGEYIKEFFLSIFGKKYPLCKCEISLFSKNNNVYSELTAIDETKLSERNIENLYLIKNKEPCKCEYKIFKKYFNMKKFEVIKCLKEKIENSEKVESEENLKLKQENAKIKEEYNQINEKLTKENSELKKIIEKLEKKEELKYHKNPIFENFYDIIININSIKNVNKEGWQVKFTEDGLEKYKKYKNKKLITIGVLGNNNKGKSFLLSKISKIKLLTGTSIHTEGLSVKYPELKGYKGRQLILLDSAGFETPVFKKINNEINIQEKANNSNEEQNKVIEKEKEEKTEIDKEIEKNIEFKENARDKMMTELFLENLIIKTSDILLIVVGKLTYSEQLLINKVKVESKKQKKERIIIIHNLQEFRTKDQVEDYIKNTLLKCSTFELNKRTWVTAKKDKEENREENDEIKINNNNFEDMNDNINEENVKEDSKLNNVHFTEILKYDDKKIEIYHLIIANEDSEAGDIYNQYAYNFIENIYNLIGEPKKFDVFDQVKDNFKLLLNIILNNNIENASFTDNNKIIEEKKMKLEFKENLNLKKCYTDELRFSFFKAGYFEPKYNYFKPDEKTLEIRLEVPGNVKCEVKHDVIGDETVISIKGNKAKDKQPEKLNYNLFNIREFSQFELNIPLKVEDFKISKPKPNEGYPKFVNGVCIIQYELAGKSEGGAAEAEGL